MTKIFKFADFGQSFQRVLGHNLVSHDAFILLTVHEIMSFLSAFLCTHTTLLERLLSTVVCLLCWVKLPNVLWFLSNLPLVVCSSLFFSWSLHWCSCHWWWEPPKTFSWLLCWYLQ